MSRTNSAGQRRKAKGYHNPPLPGMGAATPEQDEKQKDFYPTPEYSFMPLISHLIEVGKSEPFAASGNSYFWEPARGDGRLVKWMGDAGLSAAGGDIRDEPSYDFLQDKTRRGCIVTNPPFSLAEEFVRHAISLSHHVFMLLPLSFHGSDERRPMWKDIGLNSQFSLCRRPSFTGDGKTDSACYAWFYWGQHAGFRPFYWL